MEQEPWETAGRRFIDQHVRYDRYGVVDLEQTARNAHIEVRRELLSHQQATLAPFSKGWIVRIDEMVTEKQEPFIFGHELGHIALATAGVPFFGLSAQQFQLAEAVCDFFSAQMLSSLYGD